MATQSVLDPTTNLIAPDIAAQQVILGRRQQMADLLRQQSLQPMENGQMISGHYIAPSWTQGMAKMAQALMASKSQDSIDAQNLDLAKQYQGRLAGLINGPSAPTEQPISQPAPVGDGIKMAGPLGSGTALLDNIPGQTFTDTPATPAPVAPSKPSGDQINLANTLRAMALHSMSPEMASAYADRFKPTETSKDIGNLPVAMQGPAWTQKFLPSINSHSGAVLTANDQGQYVVNPASITGIAQVESAKAPYMPMRVLKKSDGSEIQLSEPEFQTWQKTSTLPSRFVSPSVQQAAQAGADTEGTPKTASSQVPGIGVARASVAPSVLGASQSNFGKEFDNKEAGRASELSGEIYKNGSAAIQKIATNNKMLSLLPTITTGPVADRVTAFRNLASSAGIDLGDPSPNQEFGKYAFQGAMQAGKQIYGSRITNADLTALIQNSPGTTLEEKASRALIQFDNELQARNIQKMTEFDAYKSGGGDLTRFEPWFEQNFPYHGISAPQSGGQVNIPPPMAPPSDGSGTDYVKKYGIKARR